MHTGCDMHAGQRSSARLVAPAVSLGSPLGGSSSPAARCSRHVIMGSKEVDIVRITQRPYLCGLRCAGLLLNLSTCSTQQHIQTRNSVAMGGQIGTPGCRLGQNKAWFGLERAHSRCAAVVAFSSGAQRGATYLPRDQLLLLLPCLT
jgi:hypothetical protein